VTNENTSLRDEVIAEDTHPLSAEEAISLLLSSATVSNVAPKANAAAARRAADDLRSSITNFESVQLKLTESLIASQDRILAMKALAQINVHGVAGTETIDLLLDKALSLTRSTLVIVFHGDSVSSTAGDTSNLDDCVTVALRSIRNSPRGVLRSAALDSAMIGTLDPEGQADQHVAFFRTTGRPFSTPDIPIIEAVVSALGVMLAFTDLHLKELKRATIERAEHQLASALAQSVISQLPPHSEEIDIFARTIPASLTGGDFFVFGQADDSLWFAVGDVAGKGLPAAMLMTRTVSACRIAFLAHREASVADVLTRIEDELFDYLEEASVFITMVVGRICETSSEVSLVNAGHSPIVLVDGTQARPIASSVPPLGVMRHRVPRIETFTLGEASMLVMGSDGLAEQSNPEGELYGYDRFQELCTQQSSQSASQCGETVFETLATYAAGTAASDDSTLVVLRRSRRNS
jgi:serine phosphatase RsbU (regulator of sigma subunit)